MLVLVILKLYDCDFGMYKIVHLQKSDARVFTVVSTSIIEQRACSHSYTILGRAACYLEQS